MMNKRYPTVAAVVACLLTAPAYAADELDLLGQPLVRSEQTIRSGQQVLWTLPFETTRYVPEQPTPTMRNAMEAQQAGRYLEAIAILEEAKGESSLPDTQLLRAGFYLQGDQARFAQEILTGLLQQSPQSAEAHALMAMALLQQGQLDAALDSVQRAQSLGNRPLATQISTYVLQARGRLQQASDVMAAHNAKSPADALGLAREAELALNLGDNTRAASRAAEAHKLAPKSPYVMAVIGLVWLIEDKPADAQRAFEIALKGDP
jgi:tetratricopeptide (TPR) repeat protein